MKLNTSVVLLALTFSTTAIAGFNGPGSTSITSTVQSVAEMKDDDKTILEGYLIKETTPEYYTFRDSTGEIEIEIDNEDFRGLEITPKTKVKIHGEIDKSWSSTTIDADYIELVK